MPIEIRYARHGRPESVLEIVRRRRGRLTPGQVRIRVEAAPIHIADLKDISREPGFGLFPLPAVPGYEGVGRVIETTRAAGMALDTRVYLPLACGAWRSELVAGAAELIRAPSTGDAAQLSLVPINMPSAWFLLQGVVSLKRGDWVIQNAANSNVGQFISVLGPRFGMRVISIVRRAAATDELTDAGARHVIYGPDVYDQARRLMGGAKAALAIDAIAGAATSELADCLRDGGTVANYGLLSGEPCHMTPQQLMFRDLRLRGFYMVHYLWRMKMPARQRFYDRLSRLVTNGVLHSTIAATYPLENFRDALRHAARTGPERHGKVVLINPG